MSKNKVISGCIGAFFGYILFILMVDILSKPSNVSLSLQPIESIETYYFGFVFSMGTIGWVLGSLLLIGFLVLCSFMGIWVHQLIYSSAK